MVRKNEAFISIRWNTASWCASSSYTKCYALFSLAVVSDYKPIDTSLNFVITNFHTELKPQVKARHNMNSLAPKLCTVYYQSWTIGKLYCLDKFRLKTEVR